MCRFIWKHFTSTNTNRSFWRSLNGSWNYARMQLVFESFFTVLTKVRGVWRTYCLQILEQTKTFLRYFLRREWIYTKHNINVNVIVYLKWYIDFIMVAVYYKFFFFFLFMIILLTPSCEVCPLNRILLFPVHTFSVHSFPTLRL